MRHKYNAENAVYLIIFVNFRNHLTYDMLYVKSFRKLTKNNQINNIFSIVFVSYG